MSGAAFNAMWTAPPPPSYTDTVGVDPTNYVVLSTSHGDEVIVHKDCLIESPVLRFCFRKRVPLNTEEVTAEFIAPDAETAAAVAAAATSETAGSVASSLVNTRRSLNTTEESHQVASSQSPEVEGGTGEQKLESEAPGVSIVSEVDALREEEEANRHPVTLTESLCTDNSVKIVFPRLNRAQLEVVVGYLYYKRHYNRRPSEMRPHFEIPASAALEVMRVAKTLNC
ncbi:hypothetical protein ABL78_2615 [Leptomonas seymouri]|uniref:Elongin-C n=1 Tax=Leptomonas seymouri TaxID=5684 RepID=A0A0N0P728_LEPSE|nr:hypothetical protein ABL78_2615 [Leptomonas seymouri]|eukprot:KPI88316.1 hypothetical protein ABL78_2615 [Leptomonas seymouri]